MYSMRMSHHAQIQCLLQDLNSNVATPRDEANEQRLKKTQFDIDGKFTRQLEEWIDRMDTELPPLTSFILPVIVFSIKTHSQSGGKAASTIHVARSICRRAERRLVPLVRDGSSDMACGIYLNRLSDYLFTAGRFMCMRQGVHETIYKRPQ